MHALALRMEEGGPFNGIGSFGGGSLPVRWLFETRQALSQPLFGFQHHLDCRWKIVVKFLRLGECLRSHGTEWQKRGIPRVLSRAEQESNRRPITAQCTAVLQG